MGTTPQARLTPCILPSALRASLKLFQIAPGDLVNIDVNTCIRCGESVRTVASIEEPTAIRAILDHFAKPDALEEGHYRPAARAYRPLWPRGIRWPQR